MAQDVTEQNDTLNLKSTLGGYNEFWSWATPVSYTHLDVYKRQLQLCRQRGV